MLLATWEGRSTPSRFSLRCGTNFGVLVLGLFAAAALWVPATRHAAVGIPTQIVLLGATMELWLVLQRSRRRWRFLFLYPGLLCQRLTTREPALEETRVALSAVASVLRRELSRVSLAPVNADAAEESKNDQDDDQDPYPGSHASLLSPWSFPAITDAKRGAAADHAAFLPSRLP